MLFLFSFYDYDRKSFGNQVAKKWQVSNFDTPQDIPIDARLPWQSYVKHPSMYLVQFPQLLVYIYFLYLYCSLRRCWQVVSFLKGFLFRKSKPYPSSPIYFLEDYDIHCRIIWNQGLKSTSLKMKLQITFL